MTYPTAYRQVMQNMLAQQYAVKDIARALNTSRQTVYAWRHQSDAKASRKPRHTKLSSDQEAAIVAWVLDNPTVIQSSVQHEVLERYGIRVSQPFVSRMLHRHCVSRKKAVKQYTERSLQREADYLDHVASIDADSLIALDECSFCHNHASAYAYSKKGSRAIVPRPGQRGSRYSLLLAIATCGVVQWSLYEGSVTAVRFQEYVSLLPPGSNVILDNAQIHHAVGACHAGGVPTVAETAEHRDITLQYLPPYCPALNPVEFCFNIIRTYVNRRQPRTTDDLQQTIEDAIQTLSTTTTTNVFRHALKLRDV